VMNISQCKTDLPGEICQEADIENNSSIDQEDGVEPVAKKMKEIMEILMTKLRERKNSRSMKKIAFQEQISNQIREDMALGNQEFALQKEIARKMKNSRSNSKVP